MNSTIPSLERYRQMCYKKNTFLFHFSLFIYDSFFSLFLFLLSFSRTSTSPFFLLFFPPFFFFVTFSTLSLSFFFFFPITLPRLLPLRSAITVEFKLADEAVAMEISDSDFFFLQLWIPCDCDYGWVGSFSSFFFWDSFVLILGIFLKVVLGGGSCWWIFVGGGGFYLWVVVAGCAWVWWWRAVLCMVGFCWRFFFFFWLRFLDLEFVGGPMIVVVVCGRFLVLGWWWLLGLCICILLGFE